METLHAYLASRRGLILSGNITEHQIYECYRRYAEARDGYALSQDAVRSAIHGEIWQIRLWWASLGTYHVEEYLYQQGLELAEAEDG